MFRPNERHAWLVLGLIAQTGCASDHDREDHRELAVAQRPHTPASSAEDRAEDGALHREDFAQAHDHGADRAPIPPTTLVGPTEVSQATCRTQVGFSRARYRGSSVPRCHVRVMTDE